ncbi:hypothetical protein [Hymenobacter rubripertinctus]|uniref:Zinc-ribbon domain-containing protein n=1 Tax=Hymenobacter rubripertinctus TaxID=2029981 RepID=A0A418R075_9BACT|nr:hypothetical protein [Hymenobacter rubripertinctus]RIY10778.1 hypothetical protein D0T11_08940 [Hymenobacter rubripertinctus]
MLIYGYQTSHLLTEPVEGSCPACAAADSLRMSVFGRYAHLYWVPLLPIGKTGASECRQCGQVVGAKEMAPQLRQSLRELKQRSRAPWWHFAGLLLAVVGLGWALVANSNDERANQSFITLPHRGDLYHVRTSNGHYSLWKVQDVAGNAVKLLANNYEIDNQTKVSELNRPENFAPDALELTRYDLEIMLEKDEIVDVERPGSE